MKDFFKNVALRVRDLVYKFLSVKGMFAITASVLYVKGNSSPENTALVIAAWVLFIGGRSADKLIDAYSKVRGK